MKYLFDLSKIADKEEFHGILAEELGLSDNYGKDMNSLKDTLLGNNRALNLIFINRASANETIQDLSDELDRVLKEVKTGRHLFSYEIFDGKEKKLSTVIFDIGNVLIKFKSLDFVREKYGDEMGLKLANALYGGGRWSELDRAVLSNEEILQTFMDADPGIPPEYIRWCYDNVARAVLRCGYAIPWLRDVRKLGYRIMYLSNYSKHVMHARPEVLDFLPLMDGGIFSCDVKLIKPDTAIYKLFAERFGLDPDECIFIDDHSENCEGAEKTGMKSYCFESYETGRPDIMNILDPNY